MSSEPSRQLALVTGASRSIGAAVARMLAERGADADLRDAMLPPMLPGGRVMFVTSHWAHCYGQKPVIAPSDIIASSKRAGEDALRL